MIPLAPSGALEREQGVLRPTAATSTAITGQRCQHTSLKLEDEGSVHAVDPILAVYVSALLVAQAAN